MSFDKRGAELGRLLGNSRDADPGHSPFDELRRTRNQIEDIVQVIVGDDGVLVQDFSGRAVYANDQAARILGAGSAERLLRIPANKLLADLEIKDADGASLESELPGWTALRTGSTLERALLFCPRNSSPIWATVRTVPMRDSRGSVVASITVFRDVTEQRRAADFHEKLLGIVSHDLKNPLAAIAVSVGLIERRADDLDPKLAQMILRIRSATERATRMIHDLLDLTQARLGRGIPIECRPVDVRSLAAAAADEVLAARPQRDIAIKHEGEALAVWDPDRITQVLVNLLTNALSYSPEESLVRMDIQGGASSIELSITNSGEPIPADKLPELFEPFMRGSEQSDRWQRSVGLGLYIVRSIIEAHGGMIAVTSSAEAGTTFKIRLPRDQPRLKDGSPP